MTLCRLYSVAPSPTGRGVCVLSGDSQNAPLHSREATDMKTEDNGPVAFFKALESAFAETIVLKRQNPHFVRDLMVQAFDSFDGNVAIQTEGLPELACHPGCAACCTLRVVVTAPEILLIANYVAATRTSYEKIGVDITGRVIDEFAITCGLNESQRMALRRRCPFMDEGLCLIYLVRPLACRGHASYDKRACIEAAAGRGDSETPVSEPHLLVRSMVQNSLLAALRGAGLSWGLYELTAAAHSASGNPHSAGDWLAGSDPFGAAAVGDVDFAEMATTFDELKSYGSQQGFSRQRE